MLFDTEIFILDKYLHIFVFGWKRLHHSSQFIFILCHGNFTSPRSHSNAYDCQYSNDDSRMSIHKFPHYLSCILFIDCYKKRWNQYSVPQIIPFYWRCDYSHTLKLDKQLNSLNISVVYLLDKYEKSEMRKIYWSRRLYTIRKVFTLEWFPFPIQ